MDADERQRTQMMIKLTAIEDAKIAAIKINLIKRQTITIDEFRTWLYQMIQDKKGALPDLDDWKMIKEQLDKVGTRRIDDDGSGYSILQSDDDEYACVEFEPYDMQFTLDLLDRLCIEAESEDNQYAWHSHDYLRTWKEDEHAMKNYKEYNDGKTKTESASSAGDDSEEETHS